MTDAARDYREEAETCAASYRRTRVAATALLSSTGTQHGPAVVAVAALGQVLANLLENQRFLGPSRLLVLGPDSSLGCVGYTKTF